MHTVFKTSERRNNWVVQVTHPSHPPLLEWICSKVNRADWKAHSHLPTCSCTDSPRLIVNYSHYTSPICKECVRLQTIPTPLSTSHLTWLLRSSQEECSNRLEVRLALYSQAHLMSFLLTPTLSSSHLYSHAFKCPMFYLIKRRLSQ